MFFLLARASRNKVLVSIRSFWSDLEHLFQIWQAVRFGRFAWVWLPVKFKRHFRSWLVVRFSPSIRYFGPQCQQNSQLYFYKTSNHPSTNRSIHQSIYLSVCSSIDQSFHLRISLSVHLKPNSVTMQVRVFFIEFSSGLHSKPCVLRWQINRTLVD